MYTTSEKYTHNSLLIDLETLEYDCRHYNKGTFKVWWHRETVCGLEVQKATQIVSWPIHVKLGVMHMPTSKYTHNTLSVDYETLEYDGRNKS